MNGKRVAIWAIVGLIVISILNNPQQSADAVQSGVGGLFQLGSNFGDFVSATVTEE